MADRCFCFIYFFNCLCCIWTNRRQSNFSTRAHTNSLAHVDSAAHIDSHSIADQYGYTDGNSHTQCNADICGCAFTDSHIDVDPESNSIGHCFCHPNLYRNPNPYLRADFYIHALIHSNDHSHRHTGSIQHTQPHSDIYIYTNSYGRTYANIHADPQRDGYGDTFANFHSYAKRHADLYALADTDPHLNHQTDQHPAPDSNTVTYIYKYVHAYCEFNLHLNINSIDHTDLYPNEDAFSHRNHPADEYSASDCYASTDEYFYCNGNTYVHAN